MTNKQMLAALAALPDAEMLVESKLTDPLGSDAYYSARTVVLLLAAERERCAKLCDALAYKLKHPADPFGSFDACAGGHLVAEQCAADIRKA